MSIHHPIDSHSGKGNVTIGTREDGQHHVSVNMLAPNTTATVAMLREAIDYIDPPSEYADGGVTCAAIEQEADDVCTRPCCDPQAALDAAKDAAVEWMISAKEAEHDRDEARRDVATAERREQEAHDRAEKAECHDCIRDAAAIREPIAPEDLTDAMADRFLDAFSRCRGTLRDALRAGIGAMSTPEPQRPEGAEDIAALLEEMPADLIGGPLTAHEARTLADHLAEHGVRVTTEENR